MRFVFIILLYFKEYVNNIYMMLDFGIIILFILINVFNRIDFVENGMGYFFIIIIFFLI